MWFRRSCRAARRAFTAVDRVSRSTRRDSTRPSLVLGVVVRFPARIARAAFSASNVSLLPRRRRSLRTDLALDALEMALWSRRTQELAGLIHHSDSEYVRAVSSWAA